MFAPKAGTVLQVTVQADVAGQSIVNYFYFKFSNPGPAVTGGDSQTFLNNFRTLYRAEILTFLLDVYFVRRYWVREIIDVVEKVNQRGTRLQNVYNPTGLDYLNGSAADDNGTISPLTTPLLPLHECVRCYKRPENPRIGFFKSAYNRFAPWLHTNLHTTQPEQWAAATVTQVQGHLTAFLAESVLDQPAGNGWNHAIWSPVYFFKWIKPLSGQPAAAAERVVQFIASSFVGTQTSRRYSPVGLIEGE